MENFLSENILHFLEIAGTAVGLIYIYLQYKASSMLWIANMLMSIIYIVIYMSEGIYAQCGINIYYVLAAIYGLLVWKFSKKPEEKEKPITSASKKKLIISSFACIFICTALISILYRMSNDAVAITYSGNIFSYIKEFAFSNPTIFLDGITTGMGIVALYFLAQKHKEHWLIWMITDAFAIALYLISELYFTAGLFVLYIITSVAGYKKWIKLMNNAKA